MNQPNKQNQRQKGFAHIGLILIAIAIIAAVAFGGWWVWDKNRDNKQASNSNNTSQTNQNKEEKPQTTGETFNCKNEFTLTYPDSLQATMTDANQCLVSNVASSAMPPVGPLPPEQLGLFFNIQATSFKTSKDYLGDHIEHSQEDAALDLKSQEEIELDKGNTATLATVFGGHPVEYEFYFFIYIKNGKAITTTYSVDSNYKDTALAILKSIQ